MASIWEKTSGELDGSAEGRWLELRTTLATWQPVYLSICGSPCSWLAPAAGCSDPIRVTPSLHNSRDLKN